MLETRTELPDAGQLDGEAAQEGDALLITTLLRAKAGDMVDLDEGDVPNSASRLQRKPFRQQTDELRKLLLRHQGGDGGFLQSERRGLERAPACQTESLYECAAPGTGRRGGASLAEAPSIQLVHGAVVRAVQALLHVVLKEPVLESRPRETAVEHADADQRARSNGVSCSLQRHLDGREWVRVFATLSRWSQSVPRCSHSESMSIHL